MVGGLEHIGGSRGLEGQRGHGKLISGPRMKEGKGPWAPEQPGRFFGLYFIFYPD